MPLDTFWLAVDDFLDQATHAASAGELIALANTYWPTSAGHAFFAGSGGDRQLIDVLIDARWLILDCEADYHFTAAAPDGSRIEYVEGDIYQR